MRFFRDDECKVQENKPTTIATWKHEPRNKQTLSDFPSPWNEPLTPEKKERE